MPFKWQIIAKYSRGAPKYPLFLGWDACGNCQLIPYSTKEKKTGNRFLVDKPDLKLNPMRVKNHWTEGKNFLLK